MALVQGCIRIGYHPCVWKTAKGILLRKQGKPTYTVAKAYRVISLLSCLGRVVERAIATWIASFCEKSDIFHRGQLGCRLGRCTSEAVAQLVSKVEDAWNKKRIALASLLDVKGAFDRVNKRQLLKWMIGVGIAGNIVRWADSCCRAGNNACNRQSHRLDPPDPGWPTPRVTGLASTVHLIDQQCSDG